ncbi:hypothetical protein CEUSTIGMA_g1583.t1 [Chlamydomonas eustigma]|uniref:protein-serine/threonine phosphatase n=1 Tax=Chlamydomonas eustigma TaxID=1157962 RepID=A0A250WTH4_9CHLO|nr:hypothetical protein CEUSTIGMA_g1583.t1 [Chlamydomonas eustigma]|eukprot:GAX74134.1 hypothetical protein CEUSTIGMA_g1583.t1 [Chlamydomonas eustigma]
MSSMRLLRGSNPINKERISRLRAAVSNVQPSKVVVKKHGHATQQGTVRKVNEDRFDVQTVSEAKVGELGSFAGVYDGHGGSATADWLREKLFPIIQARWRGGREIEDVITEAYLQADKTLLAPTGFMGMGERGMGGSKCGATAVTAALYQNGTEGTKLVTANVGDARILLIKSQGQEPVQLTVDHVPDSEAERLRIEKFNPNPKMPLVRYVGGTWRVGGLLALSRAFGDAYLKGSLQFEGIVEGSDGYGSGFGVIAQPYIRVVDLTADDQYIVLSSDGLYSEEERGGGGGLDNQEVANMLWAAGENPDLNAVASALAQAAVEKGSTDDVTVVVLKLGPQ